MMEARGGVCAPKGFKASGVQAHIKSKKTNKLDLAVLFSERPATAAGVFTTNRVKAACVLLSREALSGGTLQAIVMNSGNANCCTGEQGMADTLKMQSLTAECLAIPSQSIAVASTGVIGERLPMERVIPGIREACLALSQTGAEDAASAIMTTDTFRKESVLKFQIAGKDVVIGGMAKGSGMIHPNMATTLAFLTTDAAVDADALRYVLKKSCSRSFNMISVDGDTSTNDMIIALANGAAEQAKITMDSPYLAEFAEGVEKVLIDLAKMVVKDGEGASKLFEVQVMGAASELDAQKAARAVSCSSLVKAAIFGCDANWGRILCALGYSGAEFDPTQVDLFIGSIPVMAAGSNLVFDEEEAMRTLSQKELVIKAFLHSGTHSAKAWGCDLTYDYVKINGSYRT